jgi:hypothetical protein
MPTERPTPNPTPVPTFAPTKNPTHRPTFTGLSTFASSTIVIEDEATISDARNTANNVLPSQSEEEEGLDITKMEDKFEQAGFNPNATKDKAIQHGFNPNATKEKMKTNS